MELPVNYNNLTTVQRRLVRETYTERQKGLCVHCGKPLTGPPSEEIQEKWIDKRLFPPGMFRWPVHLHHDHDTGLTLGAIHCKCNAVLWQYHGE